MYIIMALRARRLHSASIGHPPPILSDMRKPNRFPRLKNEVCDQLHATTRLTYG